MTVINPLSAATAGAAAVEWRRSPGLVAYPDAVAAMEARVAGIVAGREPELVWLLEHPPLYTAGTSADPAELLDRDALPVFSTGRGGRYTYHGPGQRIAYVLLDLRRRGRDVRAFVHSLEEWAIRALAELGVRAERRSERIGLWVGRDSSVARDARVVRTARPRRDGRTGPLQGDDKIAAVGVRVRHWVTYHGIAINVVPDLAHFAGIVPCGVREHGVTSLADLGIDVTMAQVDDALQRTFGAAFDGRLGQTR